MKQSLLIAFSLPFSWGTAANKANAIIFIWLVRLPFTLFILLLLGFPSFGQISLVKDLGVHSSRFDVLDNKFLFNINGNTLAVSDGTAAGTVSIPSVPAFDIDLGRRCRVGNVIFYVAPGNELWKTDGTAAGTVKVKDGLANCYSLINLNGILLFTVDLGNGTKLWRSDGTAVGTFQITNQVGNGIDVSEPLLKTAVFNGFLYFSGAKVTTSIGNYVPELWRTDGTGANTTRLGGVGYEPRGMTVMNNTLFYAASFIYTETQQTCPGGINIGTGVQKYVRVIYAQTSSGSYGYAARPALIAYCSNSPDRFYGNTFENTSSFIKTDNVLYFTGTSADGVQQLWSHNGSAPLQLTNFNAASGSEVQSFPNPYSNYYNFSRLFYLPVRTAANGIELWRSDGTIAGTSLLKDLQPGAGDSRPVSFYDVNGMIYFFANGIDGNVYRTAGTTAGTQAIASVGLQPGSGSDAGETNDKLDYIGLGNNFYFSADYNNVKGIYTSCVSPIPTISASPSATICAGSSVTLTASGCGGTVTWSTGASGSSITVAPNASTVYSATCTQIGCTASVPANLSLTVNPIPSVAASSTALCAGSVSLSATDVTSGLQWQRNGVNILGATTTTYTPVQGGDYRVMVMATQCLSTPLVTVFDTPATPIITSNAGATICQGQSSVLSVTNCSGTVTWSTGTTGSSITVRPNAVTSYMATCRQNTCSASASISVAVKPRQAAPTISLQQCASTPTKTWEKKFGGSGSENLSGLIELADGNLLWLGSSSSPVSNDKTVSNFGGVDGWIVKTDANGNKLWDKVYGGTGNDFASAAVATADGGAFIALASSSPANTGNKTVGNYGGPDIWVILIDAAGTITRQWLFGGAGEDSPASLIQTGDGNLVLACGTTSAGGTGNKNGSTAPAYGNFDMWLIKLDPTSTNPTGGDIWQRSYGGSQLDIPVGIEETETGDLIIGGRSASVAGSGNKTSPSYDNSATEDYWVLRTDPTGATIRWQQSYGGTKAVSDPTGQDYGQDYIASISKGRNGNYLINGYSKSAGGTGSKTSALKGDFDGWLVEINGTDGSKVSEKALGGTNADLLYKTYPMPNGSGYWAMLRAEAPNSGDITANGLGMKDFWVVELDNTFTKRWDRRYGGAYDEGPRSALLTRTGELILAGIQMSDATNANDASQDYYAVKVTECTASTLVTSCAGQSYSLWASGCSGTVTWSTGVTGASITVTPQQSTTYTATCTQNGCTSPASGPLSVTVTPATAISQQSPASATVTAGSSVTAAVLATGTNLTYQWYTDSQSTRQPVAGQTSAILSLTNVQAGQSQTYYCLVTGSCGSVWSDGYALTVQVTCTSMYTLKNGNWNDPSVWSCGRLPVSTDAVQIKHSVTLPGGYTASAQKVVYDLGSTLIWGIGSKLTLAF